GRPPAGAGWRFPPENGVAPAEPSSGEDGELGTELTDAPRSAVFPALPFAASHATRASFLSAPGCGLLAPLRQTGTFAQGNTSSRQPFAPPQLPRTSTQ